jgi:hypothetical protein
MVAAGKRTTVEVDVEVGIAPENRWTATSDRSRTSGLNAAAWHVSTSVQLQTTEVLDEKEKGHS